MLSSEIIDVYSSHTMQTSNCPKIYEGTWCSYQAPKRTNCRSASHCHQCRCSRGSTRKVGREINPGETWAKIHTYSSVRLIAWLFNLSNHHNRSKNVLAYRKEQDSEATSARDPKTRKIHHKGLWSISPNEEWCIDGHEKILLSMGIAVWGVIDKFSRLELGLWAMPHARLKELPLALYLRLLKKQGGK